ncbi:FabD/lysophospholipase-like protein [Cenococcum geophilum 1.58]|uniref:FabD/lysophospholipase-like protein n=1 Tax=Cenococcum geophilum 1.58 TaxID=794803 RepID=UPI00358E1C74|nr:FabD/lysophospholipase-like protein [Cenococcum geophilum 1.58]
MPGKNLCLLSLDGGGVRGLSTLQILKQLMEVIASEARLDSTPKPCAYFDMIGGTSTGGLLAIMLGRLEMSIDGCIAAYTKMSDGIFKRKHHRVKLWNGQIQGRFDTPELERAIKEIVKKAGYEEDELLQNYENAPCKVFVCATSKLTSQIVHLTSYAQPRGGSDLLKATKIWEAARATAAASSFFEPIRIDVGSYGEEFIDGATGANNPIVELWNQAQDLWPGKLEDNLKCLVSIGTGMASIEPFKTGLLTIGETLVKISTATEAVAENFQRTHNLLDEENRYFRFNVKIGLEKIGLEEASKTDTIMAVTRGYVQSHDVFKLMKRCGRSLGEREVQQSISQFT